MKIKIMEKLNILKLVFLILLWCEVAYSLRNITLNAKNHSKSIINQTSPRKEKPKLHHYNFTIIHSHYSQDIAHISSFERKIREEVKENEKSPEIMNFFHKKSQKILNLIQSHNLKIKKQICKYSNEVIDSFDKIKKEITDSTLRLKNFPKLNLSKTDLYLKLTDSINNVNLIKALMVKLTNLSETLKTSKCPNFLEFSNQKLLIDNEVNMFVESIQEFIRKNDVRINLVILT